MKWLLVLVAVLVLLWLVRGSVRRSVPPPRSARRPASPQPMVACMQCGVHLPANDALPGRGGVFCGAEHRAVYEASHPA